MPAYRIYLPSCLAGLLALLSLPSAWAQPALTHAVPSAVRPGAETEIELHGSKLEGALHIWTSFAGNVEIIEQDPQAARVKCKVTLPADVPLGIAGIMIATPAGLTDTLWLMVDDLPTVTDAGNNQTPENAQQVTLPTAIDGVADGGTADYYRFNAAAGQRVSLEVVAARMASPCDPVIRVLDEQGEEILMADDDIAAGADCRASFAAPRDGTYFVELRDSKYLAGGRYRLRIGDFPDQPVAYPLGLRHGSTDMVTVTTSDGDAGTTLLNASKLPAGSQSLSARFAEGQTASWARVAATRLPEQRETEPNDDAAQATKVVLPAGINGILNSGSDRDVFEILAAKDDRFEFRVHARSLGSPALPLLRLLDPNGNQVAESPVVDTDEFTLAYVFPADGTYRLVVEDLLRRGGPNYAYRIHADRVPVAVALKTPKDIPYKHSLTADNGALALDLVCQRNGYEGEIALSLVPATAGLELLTPVIPAGAKEFRAVLAVQPGAAAGQLNATRLIATVNVNGQEYVSQISTLDHLRAKWPTMISPPGWHDGLWAVSIVPTAASFFDVTAQQPTVFVPRGFGKVSTTLTTVRSDAEYKEAPLLLLRDVPRGITPELKTEGDQHTLTIDGSASTVAGVYPVTVAAYGGHKGRGVLQRRTVWLDVNDPVSVKATAAGPLMAGKTQKLKIEVVRRGSDRQPLDVVLENLPSGVTASPASLPADQDAVEIDLAAAADAAVAQHTVVVKVTGKFQQQDLSASTSAALDIQAAQ